MSSNKPEGSAPVEKCLDCGEDSTSDVRGLEAFRLVQRKGGAYGWVCSSCAVGAPGEMLILSRRIRACQK